MKKGSVFLFRTLVVLILICVLAYTSGAVVSCQGKGLASKNALVNPQIGTDENSESTAADSEIRVDITQRELPPLEEVLREIDELPSNGVDSETLKECKVELASQLARKYVGKQVSSNSNVLESNSFAHPAFRFTGERTEFLRIPARAPEGDYGKVTNLWYDSKVDRIFWHYSNWGDYDCNGEVNVADIYEIASNLGALVDDGAGNFIKESWLDGNGDGEVGIPDIGLIAHNFMGRVDGYNVYYKFSPDEELRPLTTVEYATKPGIYPPVLFFGKDEIDDDLDKYWVYPYIAVCPFDADGSSGMMSDTFHLSDPAVYFCAMSPRGGVTGSIERFIAYPSYHSTVVNKDKQTSDLFSEMVYEWDFGGGAVPNKITGKDVFVHLGEPGIYQGTVTAKHEIGTDTGYFKLVVLREADPAIDSVWIDAYDDPQSKGVRLDIYACRITRPFKKAEVRIVFDGSDLVSGAKQTSLSSEIQSYARWMNPKGSGDNYQSRWEGSEFVVYAQCTTADFSSATRSDLIASAWIPAQEISGRRPISVELTAYPGLEDDILEAYVIKKFDGYFEWTRTDSPESLQYWNKPVLVHKELNATYMHGTGVVLTFNSSLLGDFNGDYVVDLLDLPPVAMRYLSVDNDGVLDYIDKQITCGTEHEIGVPLMSVIADHYLSSISSYIVYRDGAPIGELKVPTMRKRDLFVEPWLKLNYTDKYPPSGSHKYWFTARNGNNNSESGFSDIVSVEVP